MTTDPNQPCRGYEPEPGDDVSTEAEAVPLDLDGLDELLNKADSSPWSFAEGQLCAIKNEDGDTVAETFGLRILRNGRAIVALRNAAPQLIAAARELDLARSENERLRMLIRAMKYLFNCRALLHVGEESVFFEVAGKILGEGEAVEDAAIVACECLGWSPNSKPKEEG